MFSFIIKGRRRNLLLLFNKIKKKEKRENEKFKMLKTGLKF
jgi:hypothetical protein